MLLEDEQSFHMPQDTRGSTTHVGNTRFCGEVHHNYASIFLTVKLRQEVHYQHGPDTNLFQYGSQYYIEPCGGSMM